MTMQNRLVVGLDNRPTLYVAANVTGAAKVHADFTKDNRAQG